MLFNDWTGLFGLREYARMGVVDVAAPHYKRGTFGVKPPG